MSAWENAIVTMLILLSPVGILYGWFYLARQHDSSWRNRVSMISLSLLSIMTALWPIMLALMPRGDWSTGAGVARQMDWVEGWHKPVLRTLLAAIILGVFGRARLIGPILIGGVGIGLFWLLSTAP